MPLNSANVENSTHMNMATMAARWCWRVILSGSEKPWRLFLHGEFQLKLTMHLKFHRALLTGLAALPLLLVVPGFALDPAKSVFQFNCQNWTRQNGLSADKINTI